MSDKVFTDEDVKRLKEDIKDKTLDETVMITGAKLHALLSRLEAAERGYAVQCRNHGCVEECQAHRKSRGLA